MLSWGFEQDLAMVPRDRVSAPGRARLVSAADPERLQAFATHGQKVLYVFAPWECTRRDQ